MSDSDVPPSSVQNRGRPIAVVGRALWSDLPDVAIEEAMVCYAPGPLLPNPLTREFFDQTDQVSVLTLVKLYEFISTYHPDLLVEFTTRGG